MTRLVPHRIVVARFAYTYMVRVEGGAIAVHAQRITSIVNVEATLLNGALDLSRRVTASSAIPLDQFPAKTFAITTNCKPLANTLKHDFLAV
jgi:hypothetical protein